MNGWVSNLSGKLRLFRPTESSQTSFRRILLWRILLLSIPVLLLGQYVTYKKARSSLLETARQNLTESAIRKGESIDVAIAALRSNLLTASETSVLQSGSLEAAQAYIQQLSDRLPTEVQCIQLNDLNAGKIVASTCDNRALIVNRAKLEQGVQIQPLLPSAISSNPDRKMWEDRLQLALSAPVYNSAGQLRYALVVESVLPLQETNKPKSLSGYTVIIDQDGTVLAHRYPNRVGRDINQEKNGDARNRLQMIIRNAIAGQQRFLHLSSFDDSGEELLTGYTAIASPTTTDAPDHKWVILAATSLDFALFGLQEILRTLVYLIVGLIAAYFFATLYLARDLARPLEKLGNYASNVECSSATEPVPQNFNIREFNQLAQALNSTIMRLKAWAEELETAWKEAKVANQLKSEFLANTSHELRTPLNAIIGCIRLVRDECCDDREEELDFLQRADDAAVHLLQIINDVLDIAKIEAGTLSVVVEPVDLQQILKEVIDLQTVPIQQKGLQLIWLDENGVQQFSSDDDSANGNGNHSAKTIVRADPAKLKQVFLNVIGNAVKFTDTGSITIATRLEPVTSEANGHSHPNIRAIVTVRDTGIGIEPSQQSKLFQPFVMADGSTTRRFEGTGLGLAISRNLIELMKGNINLYSSGLGHGTTVEIALPTISSALTHYNRLPSDAPNEGRPDSWAVSPGS